MKAKDVLAVAALSLAAFGAGVYVGPSLRSRPATSQVEVHSPVMGPPSRKVTRPATAATEAVPKSLEEIKAALEELARKPAGQRFEDVE